jgi:mannosyltransferase OCH1-like enzyme
LEKQTVVSKIPKLVHYCWFGHNEKPKIVKECLSSWRKFLPDFKMMEWNEENFNFSNCQFATQAYQAKKYAFVADYSRSCVLYEYGGLYMDTDMEVLREFEDSFLMDDFFAGSEKIGSISAGIIGVSPQHNLIKEIKDYYERVQFLKADGTLDITPIPYIITSFSRPLGFKDANEHQFLQNGVHIYPVDYFYPKNFETNVLTITENTYTNHHFAGSWVSPKEKFFIGVYMYLKRLGIYEQTYPTIDKSRRFVGKLIRKIKSEIVF